MIIAPCTYTASSRFVCSRKEGFADDSDDDKTADDKTADDKTANDKTASDDAKSQEDLKHKELIWRSNENPKGKDLKKLSKISSFDVCRKNCVEEPDCDHFTYQQSSNSCWLKSYNKFAKNDTDPAVPTSYKSGFLPYKQGYPLYTSQVINQGKRFGLKQ